MYLKYATHYCISRKLHNRKKDLETHQAGSLVLTVAFFAPYAFFVFFFKLKNLVTLLFNNIFTNRFSKNKMQKPSTKCKIIFFPTVYTPIISLVLGCRNLDYKFNVPYKMCAYQFLKKYLFWNKIYILKQNKTEIHQLK